MQESGVVPELAVLLESGAMSESGMAPRFMTMLESRAIPKSRVTLLKSGMTPELVVPTEFGMPPGFMAMMEFAATWKQHGHLLRTHPCWHSRARSPYPLLVESPEDINGMRHKTSHFGTKPMTTPPSRDQSLKHHPAIRPIHHPNRPNHPVAGENNRHATIQPTKPSSGWRKTTAHTSLTRPKHPAAGEKHPPSNQLHDQNIQPLEESECWNTAKRTSSSSQWRKTPTQRPSMRPNHPVTGRNGRQAPPSEPNHPVTGEKHPPRRTR